MSWQWWVLLVGLISGGAIAASGLIAKKSPQAGDIIKKLAPHQTYLGIALFVIGVINLIDILTKLSAIGMLIRFLPITMIVIIVSTVVALVLGIFLSLSFLKSRKELPQEKMEALEKKLTPVQIPLGVVSIICGLYLFLWGIVKWGI